MFICEGFQKQMIAALVVFSFTKYIFWGLFLFLDLVYKLNVNHILFENLALYSKYENICDEVPPSTEMAANIFAKLLII